MGNTTNHPQYEQSEGDPLLIRTYRKGRKCLICKTKLSMYTNGPCCNLHSDEWFNQKMGAYHEKIDKGIKKNLNKVYRERKGL